MTTRDALVIGTQLFVAQLIDLLEMDEVSAPGGGPAWPSVRPAAPALPAHLVFSEVPAILRAGAVLAAQARAGSAGAERGLLDWIRALGDLRTGMDKLRAGGALAESAYRRYAALAAVHARLVEHATAGEGAERAARAGEGRR